MRLIFLLFSIVWVSFLWGQEISQEEAMSLGMDFMSNKYEESELKTRSHLTNVQYELAYTAEKNGEICFYVFNRIGGGFVIVSANKRDEHSILGYSTVGYFNYDNLNATAKFFIDSYKSIRENKEISPTTLSTNNIQKLTKSVNPLLGNISWGQDYPFNLLCPEINGERCVTGCIATAMAQLMYYHQWPQRGNGIISYSTQNHHIEANLSESEYRWSVMSPIYTENSSEDAKLAVALLMRDCGYSVSMHYDINESGANTASKQWIYNFDYDKGIRILPRSMFVDEDWYEIIHTELDNGRPVIYEGADGGGHSFICDGYDNENYFHYNFGWDGNGNGYYLSEETFQYSQVITCGLEKNHGGEHILDFLSASNFMFDNKDNKFTLGQACIYDVAEGAQDRWTEDAILGVEVKNINNGDIQYFESEVDYPLWVTPSIRNFDIYNNIAHLDDGDYIIWPVCRRRDGDGKWVRCTFKKDCLQKNVSLSVKDGEYTYINEIFNDNSYGLVFKDGLFYSLNEEDCTASLTIREDMQGWYNGDIVIPSEVEINDRNYKVNSIDKNTFWRCELLSITIPPTIKRIGSNALKGIYLNNDIVFPEDSELEFIDDYAFDCIHNWEKIILPENLKVIGEGAFRSVDNLKYISIPSSVTSIGEYAFMWSKSVNDIFVYWEEPLSISPLVFYETELSKINLYVPKGTKEKYENVYPWSEFIIHDFNEFTEEEVIIDNIKYSLRTPDMTAVALEIEASCPADVLFPQFITHNGQSFQLIKIGDWAGKRDNVYLTSAFIPKNVNALGDYAFRNQDELTKVTFEEDSKLRIIGSCCFDECSHLDDVELPQSLEYISSFAFSDCNHLKQIDFPKSVKSIDQSAFRNCPLLRDVIVHWNRPLDIHYLAFENNDLSQVRLHVPYGTKVRYEEKIPWSQFGEIIEDIESEYINIETIILNPDSWKGKVGETFKIEVSILPENASDIILSWDSSNETVATVDENGTITTIGYGEAIIEASCGNVKAYCAVTVEQEPIIIEAESIELNILHAELKANENIVLTTTIYPEDTFDKSIIWSSENESVAIVDEAGVVTAIAPGETYIFATCGNAQASCLVTVEEEVTIIEAEYIVINYPYMEVGINETFELTATVYPENTTDKTIEWSSQDESIATVEEIGFVTPIAPGTTQIYATCGNAQEYCMVKVLSDEEGVDSLFEDSYSVVKVYDTKGILVGDILKKDDIQHLQPGLYILRSGGKVQKIVVQ